ncbi:MAG: hypothetical protein AB7I79_12675 [Rhizobiaceae bacterium]
MAIDLPPHVWFVRSNGGSGSYPVTPEGWRAVWYFAGGMAVSAIAAIVLAMTGPVWLWVAVFAAGAAFSAWRFIDTARRHTDYTITYNEYVRRKTVA